MIDDVSRKVAEGRIGTTLRGKYRLDRVLGVGGMAAVYAATHRNKKRFAIKMLHPELSGRQDVRTRFLREGYVANSVGHTGAVAVLDDDVAEDGSAFLVMELLEGTPLDALAEKHAGRRLPLPLALSIGDALLDVLAAAHAKGIVHRDLKPANLFLTDDGRLEVLDFGIARLHDAASEHATQTGAMLGTPAFMAPEQAKGESKEIDAQTDLWAVGATLFTLVSGALVHEASNAQMLMVRAATTKARALASVASEVPTAIAEVIDRALAFEKTERWPSATAMREALVKAAGTIAPLPKTDRALGLEATAAPNANVASGTAFDSTVQTDDAKPTTNCSPETPPTASFHGATRRPLSHYGVGAAIVGAVAVAAIGVLVARGPERTVPVAPIAAPSAPAQVTDASTPTRRSVPKTGNPEALASYLTGYRKLRDAMGQEAFADLRHAMKADPSVGAIPMLFVVFGAVGHEPNAFRLARGLRDTLDERDREVLDVAELVYGVKRDFVEAERRALALNARYPDDAELIIFRGSILARARRFADAGDVALSAFDKDPSLAGAFNAAASWFANAKQFDRARQVDERCIAAFPNATACLTHLGELDAAEGRCSAWETSIRSRLAQSPGQPVVTGWLADALESQGAPLPDVLSTLQRSLDNAPDGPLRLLLHEGDIFLRRGDFPTALARFARANELQKGEQEEYQHLVRGWWESVATREEMGDAAGAGREAADWLAHRRAFTGHHPLTPVVLVPYAVRGGAMTVGEAMGIDVTAGAMPELSVNAPPWRQLLNLELATDLRGARSALAPLGDEPTLSGELPESAASIQEFVDYVVARARYLAGDYSAAIHLAEPVSLQCSTGLGTLGVQATLLLAHSREAAGDTAGACQAYAKVLSRWGNAKPRSVTAEEARRRVTALRCPK